MRVLTMAGSAAAAGLALMALSSCATLNEDECNVVDWQSLGMTNGAQGQPSTYIAQHQEACARFGITVNATAWQTGWEQGIRSYCTPTNGLTVGSSGRLNRNSCPANLASSFNEAYNVGRSVYDARQRRDSIQNEIDRLITSLGSAESDEQRNQTQIQIELRRNALSTAQADLTRAEVQADLFRLELANR